MEAYEDLEDPQSQSCDKPSLAVPSLHYHLLFQLTQLQIIYRIKTRSVGQIEEIWCVCVCVCAVGTQDQDNMAANPVWTLQALQQQTVYLPTPYLVKEQISNLRICTDIKWQKRLRL